MPSILWVVLCSIVYRFISRRVQDIASGWILFFCGLYSAPYLSLPLLIDVFTFSAFRIQGFLVFSKPVVYPSGLFNILSKTSDFNI